MKNEKNIGRKRFDYLEFMRIFAEKSVNNVYAKRNIAMDYLMDDDGSRRGDKLCQPFDRHRFYR